MVEVRGQEAVGASVDAVMIDSPSGAPRALRDEYPPINAELDAVVAEVRAYHLPAWVRMTLRATDLDVYRQPCGLCGTAAVLSAGGDGVSMQVRSADGPGAASLVAHRRCLIERLHPHDEGASARVASVGQTSTV
jgi:hypothetical protein